MIDPLNETITVMPTEQGKITRCYLVLVTTEAPNVTINLTTDSSTEKDRNAVDIEISSHNNSFTNITSNDKVDIKINEPVYEEVCYEEYITTTAPMFTGTTAPPVGPDVHCSSGGCVTCAKYVNQREMTVFNQTHILPGKKNYLHEQYMFGFLV